MEEYLAYLNPIKNIQHTTQLQNDKEETHNNHNRHEKSHYYKRERNYQSNYLRKKRYEKNREYKDLDDPENHNYHESSRTMVSYDDL